MNSKKELMLVVAINLLMIVSFIMITNNGVYHHEKAHEAIAINYGCLEGKITQDKFKQSGTFECQEYMERPDYIIEEEIMLHSMNEIEAYNQIVTNQILFFFMFMVVNTIFIVNIYKNIKNIDV